MSKKRTKKSKVVLKSSGNPGSKNQYLHGRNDAKRYINVINKQHGGDVNFKFDYSSDRNRAYNDILELKWRALYARDISVNKKRDYDYFRGQDVEYSNYLKKIDFKRYKHEFL